MINRKLCILEYQYENNIRNEFLPRFPRVVPSQLRFPRPLIADVTANTGIISEFGANLLFFFKTMKVGIY